MGISVIDKAGSWSEANSFHNAKRISEEVVLAPTFVIDREVSLVVVIEANTGFVAGICRSAGVVKAICELQNKRIWYLISSNEVRYENEEHRLRPFFTVIG